MSVSPHPRPTHPFLRKAACLTIGLGSLLLAGNVLSSVVNAPASRAPSDPHSRYAERPVYAFPVSPAAGPFPTPMVALVRFHQGILHVTNASPYPWRAVQVLSRADPPTDPALPLCPALLPRQTCEVSLRGTALAPPDDGSGRTDGPRRPIFSVSWVCRTGTGTGVWRGDVVR